MKRTPVVLILFGTRPEAIKLAPVTAALRARPEAVDVRVVSTGQHDDLLVSALSSLDMEIDANLEIMRPDQDLYDIATACLARLGSTLRSLKPDIVVVQGDTATVFLGALAAFFEKLQIAHVEAGLRSHEKWAPYPEEMFRRMTDVLTDHYFAPTLGAKQNLIDEGIPGKRINVTGNTVIDAVKALARSGRPIENAELSAALSSGKRLILVTIHRRESFGEPIRESFGALRTLALEWPDYVFVYPVHPNPNVVGPAREILSGIPNFQLLDPLSYSDLVAALSSAWLVFTDSGCIQEEAPSFELPVLVLRNVTERPEGLAAGVAALVGTSADRIVRMGRELLGDEAARRRMAQAANPYGDGRAGERIADILLHRLTGAPRRTEDWS